MQDPIKARLLNIVADIISIKIPCGRCVTRNVTCDPRQARRWANYEANNPVTTATQPPKRATAPAETTTSVWDPATSLDNRTRETAPTHSKAASESTLTFGIDSFQNDLSKSRSDLPAETLQTNCLQQIQTVPMTFSPKSSITNEGDVMMMGKFQDFVSTYTHGDLLDFDTPMLFEEQFFQQPYLAQLAQTPERSISPSSMTKNVIPGECNSNGTADLPLTANTYGLPPTANQLAINQNEPSRSPVDAQDDEAVLTSRKHWSSFKCIPPEVHTKCPRTAGVYFESLLQTLSNHDEQVTSASRGDTVMINTSTEPLVSVVALDNFARDKLLVCTQALLQKALQSHRNQPFMTAKYTAASFHHLRRANDAFIVLPASEVLDSYIRTYACRFEHNYPVTPSGQLGINTSMQLGESRTPALLLLLMIALGSMNHRGPRVQYLANGLTEVCRIGVSEALEGNVDTQWDICSLKSALLFTILAAWGGDKWHMDVGPIQSTFVGDER